MSDGGSVQLRRYEQAREFGHLRADAAAYAGIPLSEAELIDREMGWESPHDGED